MTVYEVTASRVLSHAVTSKILRSGLWQLRVMSRLPWSGRWTVAAKCSVGRDVTPAVCHIELRPPRTQLLDHLRQQHYGLQMTSFDDLVAQYDKQTAVSTSRRLTELERRRAGAQRAVQDFLVSMTRAGNPGMKSVPLVEMVEVVKHSSGGLFRAKLTTTTYEAKQVGQLSGWQVCEDLIDPDTGRMEASKVDSLVVLNDGRVMHVPGWLQTGYTERGWHMAPSFLPSQSFRTSWTVGARN